MSLEEFEEKIDPKTKRYIGMKSLMDIGMGIIYVGVGSIIFFAKKLHLTGEDGILWRIFAGVIAFYGLWRIYRGIKKDYFVER